MTIYDKAAWQLDGGMEHTKVISHFDWIFHWLDQHNMLNEDGQELLDIGIDSAASLHSGLLEEEGVSFFDLYYDAIIRDGKYNIVIEQELIEKYYREFTLGQK